MVKVCAFSLLLTFLYSCGVKKPPLPPLKEDQKIERSKIND